MSSNLIDFLTSKEIMVVYLVAVISCLLCFIVYLVEKNHVRRKQRHNTRELNKLVEQVKEETHIEEEPDLYDTPVLETIEKAEPQVEEVQVVPVKEPEEIRDEIIVEPMALSDTSNSVPMLEDEVEEELEYTSIEPDPVTAQMELQKVTEELRKQEELLEKVEEADSVTTYEEQQEENAIISLEELLKKSKEMYEANEVTQYADDGNEPITLQELEQKVGLQATDVSNENFVIEQAVPKEELSEEEKKTLKMDDFHTIVPPKEVTTKKFKSSPIISPIYGIEQEVSHTDIELENTANYEKLDAEIQKTNEFLMTLKELQQKLD